MNAYLNQRALQLVFSKVKPTQCIIHHRFFVASSSSQADGGPKNEKKVPFQAEILPKFKDEQSGTPVQVPPSIESVIQSMIPDKLIPYSKLMRLEKPTGTLLLLYPSLWGIALATPAGWIPDIATMSTFALGATLMRGAGCTINDMWDRKYDSQVERTKNRPLASGQLTSQDALFLLAGQLGASALILSTFDMTSITIGASSLVLVTFYPLAKRVTYWAQVILGATFNWGVLLGYSVSSQGCFDPMIVLPAYFAGICWTIIYDTIYAHQDKSDDLMIGLKSTAIKFGDDTAKWLSFFSIAMVGSLLISGLAAEQTWPYYASLAFVSGHLANQIRILDINNSRVCWQLFCRNWQIGLAIFLGIAIGTAFKEKKSRQSDQQDIQVTVEQHQQQQQQQQQQQTQSFQ